MDLMERITERIRSHKGVLAERFHVSDIGVFGSCVRGEEQEGSDIDIVVEFSRPIGLFHFIRLERYLADILDTEVDLVPREGIKPSLKETILNEVVYV